MDSEESSQEICPTSNRGRIRIESDSEEESRPKRAKRKSYFEDSESCSQSQPDSQELEIVNTQPTPPRTEEESEGDTEEEIEDNSEEIEDNAENEETFDAAGNSMNEVNSESEDSSEDEFHLSDLENHQEFVVYPNSSDSDDPDDPTYGYHSDNESDCEEPKKPQTKRSLRSSKPKLTEEERNELENTDDDDDFLKAASAMEPPKQKVRVSKKRKGYYEKLVEGLRKEATDSTLEPTKIIQQFRVLRYEDSKECSGSCFIIDPTPQYGNYKCSCGKNRLRYLYHMENIQTGKQFIVGSTCILTWYAKRQIYELEAKNHEPFGAEFVRWLKNGIEANFRGSSESLEKIWNPHTRELELVDCTKYKLTLESKLIAKNFPSFQQEYNAQIALQSKANEVLHVEVLVTPEKLKNLHKTYFTNGSHEPKKDSRHLWFLEYRANDRRNKQPPHAIRFFLCNIKQLNYKH